MGKTQEKIDSLSRKAWYGFAAPLIERTIIAPFSIHGNTPFFSPDQFPWAQAVEDKWEVIRAELDQVLTIRNSLPALQEISSEFGKTETGAIMTDDEHWKVFFFYGFGHKIESNCGQCPETTKIVENIPGMKTAFFSILSPGKHLPRHRGYFKGLLRYHLGLKVPANKEDCKIQVGDEFRYWEEGKSLIFDDSYPHEVWNNTDSERVVLFIDIERPLTRIPSLVNKFFISLFASTSQVKRAIVAQNQWSADTLLPN